MATKIQVTPDQVRRVARQIDSDVLQFRDSWNNVYRASDEMRGHWAGKDNVAYNNSINEKKRVFEQMERLMQEYIEFLDRSATEYDRAQDGVIADVRNI